MEKKCGLCQSREVCSVYETVRKLIVEMPINSSLKLRSFEQKLTSLIAEYCYVFNPLSKEEKT